MSDKKKSKLISLLHYVHKLQGIVKVGLFV